MEDARAAILDAVNGTGAAGLVFTSGGTEANALALSQAPKSENRHFDYIVVSEGEHDSVYVGAPAAMGKPVSSCR